MIATNAEIYLATLKQCGFRARPQTQLYHLLPREYVLSSFNGFTNVYINGGDDKLTWFRFRNEDGAYDSNGTT